MSLRVRRGAFKRSCRRCSWVGVYDTVGKGDYAKRRHSCVRRQRIDARLERGRARMGAVDRTPKPCLHPIAEHEHGTYACYTLDRCRCEPCCVAVSVYEKDRQRQHAYGRWDNFVDAEPARQHVLWLMTHGMGLKRVVATGAITQGSAWKLVYGRNGGPVSARLRKDVAERVLAVQLDLADGARISGADTARRLQALVANGWSMSKLGMRLGVTPGNFNPTVRGLRGVHVATAKAVHALYIELATKAPPEATHRDKIAASRARGIAVQRGWLPPMHINGRLFIGAALPGPDDGDVATDFGAIDEMAVERLLAGDLVPATVAEKREVVRIARARGMSLREIELRTGITKPERYIVREGAVA